MIIEMPKAPNISVLLTTFAIGAYTAVLVAAPVLAEPLLVAQWGAEPNAVWPDSPPAAKVAANAEATGEVVRPDPDPPKPLVPKPCDPETMKRFPELCK